MLGVSQENIKRRAIFDYYRMRADIILLQETHSSQDVENRWRHEWGGRILFSHGTTSARGVCILFSRNKFINITDVCSDSEGRILMCNINEGTTESDICLCNVYGPNKDTPAFFGKLSELLAKYSEHKLIMGDFNVVQNVTLDQYGSTVNNNKAKEKLNVLMDTYYLTDVWRQRNPDTLRFSWKRTKPKLQASRIDYALVSHGLSNMIKNCSYLMSMMTDHSAMYVFYERVSNERGCGYWKLNTELLKRPEAVEEIRSWIPRTIARLQQQSDNKLETWANFKSKVAQHLQSLSRQSATEAQLVISQLSKKCADYEDNLPLNEHDNMLYEETKCELDEKQRERAKAVIFRSRANWKEFGEKSSKYFFNLEKARYNHRTSSKIIKDDGFEITSDSDILKEQYLFYQQLYRKDPDIKYQIENKSGICISEEQKQLCALEISENEIISALNSMKLNKTPGPDGLSVEFYKVFWSQISTLFLNMLQDAEKIDEIASATKDGFLNLIPKGNKDSRYLKNLHPITLLNVDYKLIEKILALRMDKILPSIINDDQCGFMQNRRIATNIRKILDLMTVCKQEETEGIILNLDYIKCFDRISFDSILGSLNYFHFPTYMTDWIRRLNTGFTVRVQNNGKFTERIDVERSVHQGGCISVQLFLLCAETIAIEIRSSKEISGIIVGDLEYLLNQYADDMNTSSEYDQKTLNHLLESLEWFRLNTGFTISYEKTTIMRIGSLRRSEARLYTQMPIAWTNDPVNILGIRVNDSESELLKNYTCLLDKCQAILSSWTNRGLSLFGKINVINTLVASQFVYKMTVLPSMPCHLTKRFEQLFTDFIWNGRKAKIKASTLQGMVSVGGAKLVNLKWRDWAIKTTWVKILQTDIKMSNLAYYFLSKTLQDDIWKCNCMHSDADVVIKAEKNQFWHDVYVAWCHVNYVPDQDRASSFLWYNSIIRIDGKPFLWRHPYKMGLKFVQQLFIDGRVISIREAYEAFGLSIMELNMLLTAIPREWI